jgi:hypothetical protein
MMEEETIQEEKRGIMARLRDLFSSHKEEEEGETEEEFHYKRRLFDGRIEKYLDQNLDAYISEYGIVTGLDLEVYEERYTRLTGKVSVMTENMADMDAKVSVLEKELGEVQKASKKK